MHKHPPPSSSSEILVPKFAGVFKKIGQISSSFFLLLFFRISCTKVWSILVQPAHCIKQSDLFCDATPITSHNSILKVGNTFAESIVKLLNHDNESKQNGKNQFAIFFWRTTFNIFDPSYCIVLYILYGHMSISGTWNSWWAFHKVQLRAAAVQHPWVEAKVTLPKVPMPWHPPVLVIAVRDKWWEEMESGTYPINSGMSRVFYLPQHRTLSTRQPLALRRMRSTGCWVCADESQFWKFLGSPPGDREGVGQWRS